MNQYGRYQCLPQNLPMSKRCALRGYDQLTYLELGALLLQVEVAEDVNVGDAEAEEHLPALAQSLRLQTTWNRRK